MLTRTAIGKVMTQKMGDVDPAFIQVPEQRPKPSIIEDKGIPVIDLSPIFHHEVSNPSVIEAMVKEIGSACKEWGFFQVTNHGVLFSLRQRIEQASAEFFALSLEEKRKVSKSGSTPTGYYDTEHTKNVRDWKEVFDFLAKEPSFFPITSNEQDDRVTQWTNPSPDYPSYFRVIIQDYIKEMEKLAFKLLELVAQSLGLEAKRFEEFFIKNQTSFIRLNHYPPCPYPHLALGVGPHKDPVALTILSQDEVGGLEVKRKTDQEWIRVKPTQGAYIVNVGDIIQRLFNLSKLVQVVCAGRVGPKTSLYAFYKTKLSHIGAEKERFSIAFFFFPAHDTQVKPLEELINEKNSSKYMPYNWGKFLVSRQGSNSEKQNVENLQIYHYKIVE